MSVLPPDPVFTLHSSELTQVHSICFNCYHENQTLLTGTQDGKIFSWNLMTNRINHKLTGGDSAILNLCHNYNKLYSQEKNGVIKIWNKTEADYTLSNTLNSEYCGFCRFQISDSGNTLVGPEENAKMNLYSIDGEKLTTLTPVSGHNLGQIMCFKCLNISGNEYILAAYESGDVFLWDLKMQKSISSLKLKEFPLTMDYDLVSNRGIYGSSSENIQVFSISKGDFKMSLKCDIVMKNPGVNVLKIRHDKKVFVSGGWDGKLRVYSWKSLRPLAVLTEHKMSLQDICFSKEPITLWNSPIMAAAGLDSMISLWDIYNG